MKSGAHAPRVQFGAPSRRTRTRVAATNQKQSPSHDANDEGVVGCTRGGRAPQKPLRLRAFAVLSVRIVTRREDLSRQWPPDFVAQVSKPAVSPISKSAELRKWWGWRVEKSAIQQTWKSALLGLRRQPRCAFALKKK
jgi:hypothetical protein